MSAPIANATFGPLHVGDTKDDDGAIIDSFFIETDAPPTPVQQAIAPEPREQTKPTTRLVSGAYILDPTWVTPTMILPADPNRTDLRLIIRSPTAVATDGVVVGSEASNMQSMGRVLVGSTGSATLVLSGEICHTGAVWIQSVSGYAALFASASATVRVEFWATTL